MCVLFSKYVKLSDLFSVAIYPYGKSQMGCILNRKVFARHNNELAK